MITHVRFVIGPSVLLDDVLDTLVLSRLAVESLFGPARVCLEGKWHVNRDQRVLSIDYDSEIGKTLSLICAGFLEREFGTDAVVIQTVGGLP